MKSHIYILLFLLAPTFLLAQNKSKKGDLRTEIGLNITNTLAGFFNSGGSDLPTDRYLFSLKFSKPKGALRFGLNFDSRSSNELINTGDRNDLAADIFFRGGYEWRKKIDHGFTLYYGWDALVEWEFERNTFISRVNFETITSRQSTYSFGGGPVLGIQYQIAKNIAFSTEASIYGLFQIMDDFQEIGLGIPPEDRRVTGYRISPAIPSSLYLIMIF